MNFYLVLAIVTLVIFFIGWKIWDRTKNIGFIIGLFFIYYWTLLGSWFLIYDSLTGKGEEIGLHYHYLFIKMFPVDLDKYYMLSIIYYSLFIISLELLILYLLPDKKNKIIYSKERIHINLTGLMVISIICVLLSSLIIYREIIYSLDKNVSIYHLSRNEDNPFFTLHQTLNQMAIVSLLLGFVCSLEPQKNKLIFATPSKFQFALYLPLLILVEVYFIFLGNKSNLLFAGIFCFLFYLINKNYTFNLRHILFLFLILGVPLIITDTLRNYSIFSLLEGLTGVSAHDGSYADSNPDADITVANIIQSFLFSNELFSGHFSMYGVLMFDTPFTYGSSIISFVSSIIPRIFWSDRPASIYEYYADSVNAIPGQGYTINHATAWYLNFGILGIICGAIILGIIWVKVYKLLHSSEVNIINSRIFRLVAFVAFPSITAQIPKLIRTGPEGYKGVILDGIIIPVIILYIASELFKAKQMSSETDEL